MIIRLIKFLFLAISISFGLLLISNITVVLLTKDRILSENERLPSNFNVIVLGTSKKFASGSENLFYKNRMLATKRLLEKSNPSRIILSGSNPSVYYNEPMDMQSSLIDLGFEESTFEIDSHGNNTFESIQNYHHKYANDSLIIITQKFHAYRTLLICKQFGIKALVFPAEAVSADITNKPLVREVFARTKALWDFYLFEA
jgi:SanA protein